MRRALVVGNWKMNPTSEAEAVALAAAIAEEVADSPVEVIVCPPFVWLSSVVAAVSGRVGVGAQNLHPAGAGAYTGEVSGPMIAPFASHVIVGHSERRAMGESDADVGARAASALASGLTPIIAVGESAAERAAGEVESVISRQLSTALAAITDLPGEVVIAYEPVWAIGTGIPARPEHAERAGAFLRRELAGRDAAQTTRILYGGSVTAETAGAFFAEADVDGALVGGASLSAETFAAIVRAAA